MSAIPMIDDRHSMQARLRLVREHGAQLTVIALLAALALDGALVLSRALGSGDAVPATVVAAPPPARPTVNPTLRLAGIVNAHLFGLAGATSDGDAPPTTAALVLSGVLADRDPARGQAIIGEKSGPARLYVVGAAIPGGAHLRSVYADHVLIERNGALESLVLPRTPLKMTAPPPAATPLLRSATAGGRDNATLLAGIMRVQPVFNQGKLDGYRIFPGSGRGASAFQEIGLRPGDMIVAVNGTSLDDPSRAMEVLQTLSSSGSATVTVSRDGATQEVSLNLATLNSIVESTEAAGAQSAAAGAGGAPGASPGPTSGPGPGFGPPQRMRFGQPAAAPGEGAGTGAGPGAAPGTGPVSGDSSAQPAPEDGPGTNAERQR